MLDYEKLYRILFNGITDALGELEGENLASAKETLVRAQQAAEDYYIAAEEGGGGENGPDGEETPDPPVYVLPPYGGETATSERKKGILG